MRIMMLSLNYIPKQGGVEIATSLIANELSNRGPLSRNYHKYGR